MQRVATQTVSGRIAGLEQVGGFGGKAVALAEGELYMNDPDFYKKRLDMLAKATPAAVTAAMQKWLRRPVYSLRVVPGERGAYEEAAASKGSRTGVLASPAYYRRSEEHTSELQSLMRISYAVFCLQK